MFVVFGRLLTCNTFNFSGLVDIKQFLIAYGVRFRIICMIENTEMVQVAGKLYRGIFPNFDFYNELCAGVAIIWDKSFYQSAPPCTANPLSKATLYPTLSAFFSHVYSGDPAIVEKIVDLLPRPESHLYLTQPK